MSQLKRCVKCGKIPEEILTLSCTHDLCLDCASQRLAYELNKNAAANSVVCEICYERTLIDQRSVTQLKKILQRKISPTKMSRIEKNERLEKLAASSVTQDRWRKDVSPVRLYNYNSQINNPVDIEYGSTYARTLCHEHPQEQILYFCFNCLCQCICPECIIHGKHNGHDVKTIRKAHPIVKNQLQKNLQKIEVMIENLQNRRSEIDQSVRSMSEQSSQAKAQIQRSFEEIRTLMLAKEKEILLKCDEVRTASIQEAQKASKGLLERIEQLRIRSATINQNLKKDQLRLLNFYANKGKLLDQQFKEGSVKVFPWFSLSIQKIMLSIKEVAGSVNRIASTVQLRQR